MTHYTCDRCKSVIDPAQRTRYIVQVEVHSVAAHQQVADDSGEVDSLSLLHQMLEGIESKPITLNDCCDDLQNGDDVFALGLGMDDRGSGIGPGGIEQSSEIDPSDDVADDELPTHRAQYELCPECYRTYLRNPLGRDQVPTLHFSKN
ncbi:MAG TPA: hypothetical protein DDZ51_27250 [Planctomycetaceae bacterium]|nr:hypothetical protein [Planctomycetaceae bacterium]